MVSRRPDGGGSSRPSGAGSSARRRGQSLRSGHAASDAGDVEEAVVVRHQHEVEKRGRGTVDPGQKPRRTTGFDPTLNRRLTLRPTSARAQEASHTGPPWSTPGSRGHSRRSRTVREIDLTEQHEQGPHLQVELVDRADASTGRSGAAPARTSSPTTSMAATRARRPPAGRRRRPAPRSNGRWHRLARRRDRHRPAPAATPAAPARPPGRGPGHRRAATADVALDGHRRHPLGDATPRRAGPAPDRPSASSTHGRARTGDDRPVGVDVGQRVDRARTADAVTHLVGRRVHRPGDDTSSTSSSGVRVRPRPARGRSRSPSRTSHWCRRR